MSFDHKHSQFWVIASNIHTDEAKTYGPFAGPPQLTYELLRANEDKGPPFEIFQFSNAWYPDLIDSNDPAYSSWVDQEGDIRYDGWRALQLVTDFVGPDGRATQAHTEPVGPYWTDLVIHTEQP